MTQRRLTFLIRGCLRTIKKVYIIVKYRIITNSLSLWVSDLEWYKMSFLFTVVPHTVNGTYYRNASFSVQLSYENGRISKKLKYIRVPRNNHKTISRIPLVEERGTS